jgi:two-component system LytT family response regulator
MISTCIIDDEQHAITLLSGFIAKTPGLSLVASFTDPLLALNAISSEPPVVTFLDIDMPGLNGLEFAGLVRGLTRIVFTTSFREFGPEAFDRDAADYLLKPVPYERFLKCIQKIKGAAGNGNDAFLLLKGNSKGKFHKVMPGEIIYIESELHYIHIHFRGQEPLKIHLTIPEIAARLPATDFIRIHRSFIINLKWLQAIEQNQVRMAGAPVLLPIGRDFRENFLTVLEVPIPAGVKEITGKDRDGN